jgi:hypothetical protein
MNSYAALNPFELTLALDALNITTISLSTEIVDSGPALQQYLNDLVELTLNSLKITN